MFRRDFLKLSATGTLDDDRSIPLRFMPVRTPGPANRIGEPTATHWHGLTPPWQQDGVAIRKDADPDFMSLVLLEIYAQAMLSALAGGPFGEDEIRHLIRIVVEGIGEKPTLSSAWSILDSCNFGWGHRSGRNRLPSAERLK